MFLAIYCAETGLRRVPKVLGFREVSGGFRGVSGGFRGDVRVFGAQGFGLPGFRALGFHSGLGSPATPEPSSPSVKP